MFYQLLGTELLSAADLFGPGWQLNAIDHERYTYPAYGWHWFDTEAEARAFFGLPPAEEGSDAAE